MAVYNFFSFVVVVQKKKTFFMENLFAFFKILDIDLCLEYLRRLSSNLINKVLNPNRLLHNIFGCN